MTGPLVAVEQASLSGITVAGGAARIVRNESTVRPMPVTSRPGPGDPDLVGRLRTCFEQKIRWEAIKFADSDQLDFPPRYRVDEHGALARDYELVALPRTGTVYTVAAVHMAVPGLRTPSALVIVEVDVRALVKVTGTDPDCVDIGNRGRLVLRRIAVRQGVPDYGYAFQPEPEAA